MKDVVLSAEAFFRETQALADLGEVKTRAGAFVSALAAKARQEAENILSAPGWSRLRSVTLQSALVTPVDLSVSMRQNVLALEACSVSVRDRILSEKAVESAGRRVELQIAVAANEFCCFANKNRPSAAETVRLCSSIR